MSDEDGVPVRQVREYEGIPLAGGRFASPVRKGDVVERSAGPGRENVHALLAHLHERGIDTVPRPVGVSADGSRETLSYIEGASGFPPLTQAMRSDETLVQVVRAVRAIHDATQDFVPPTTSWHYQEIARPIEVDCIGHLDLAPWNFIFRGGDVVGVIDWDTAAPTTRVWDLSYLAYQFVPMHPDVDLPAYGWDEIPDRPRRLHLIADTYGDVTIEELLDTVAIRLAATAAMMKRQIRVGNPAYCQPSTQGHAQGWQNAAAHVIHHSSAFVGEGR